MTMTTMNYRDRDIIISINGRLTEKDREREGEKKANKQ